jgi:hypothetical protein
MSLRRQFKSAQPHYSPSKMRNISRFCGMTLSGEEREQENRSLGQEIILRNDDSHNPYLLVLMASPWWVLAGGFAGLAGSILWLVLWVFRLRQALAEKGMKYTSITLVLLPALFLPSSVHLILREVTVIRQGGEVDTALVYALAALGWIFPVTMAAGMMLDAWGTQDHATIFGTYGSGTHTECRAYLRASH